MADQKPFDIVVWGASGFTGRLVCEHVARDYRGQVKFAMAGRNRERLEKVRLELSEAYGEDLKDVPILLGDLSDQSSLDAIAKATKVIITTAGPFLRLGTPIVDAAVRMGAHYVDITGEVPYVMNLIRTYHDQAAQKKLRIVPCCGFDSIPSDLGAYLVVDYIKKKLGKQTSKVVSVMGLTVMGPGVSGVSGGTIASEMEQAEEVKKQGMPLDTGVYSFLPPGAPKGDDGEFWGVEYEPTLKRWLAPCIEQCINNRVVHRTAALLGYGPGFKYQEATRSSSWLAAQTIALVTAAAGWVLGQKWLQPVLKKVLPAPGEGPSRDAMLSGFYHREVVGYTKEEGSAKPTAVVALVEDCNRDPGYWGTSRMLLEAGLCLALQQAELDADPSLQHGGVLTPASAMNGALLERLRAAGIEYKIKEVVRPSS